MAFEIMISISDVFKWTITLGGKQNFLSAPWVTALLRRTPESRRRARALWLLSLSPHYFFLRNAPEYAGMTEAEYREAFFETGRKSRQKIFDEIFADMQLGPVAMDYGCGTGLFARILARNVEKVYACDISKGAIAAARVLNPADNLEYLTADEDGLPSVPDHSIDTLISLNMIQHLTVPTYDRVLKNMASKVKPGGKAILHIQCLDPRWKTEAEWLADRSIRGQLKYKFGLHCFSLAEETHKEMVAKHGFRDITVAPVSSFTDHYFDDIGDQHILIGSKI